MKKNIQLKLIIFFVGWITANYSFGQQAPVIQWQKCLGGMGDEWAYSIIQTSDSGYFVVGYTDSNDSIIIGNHGGRDYLVVKLDSSGNIQWQKCLGGTGFDNPYAVQQSTDGGFLIVGQTSSNDGDISGNNGSYDFSIIKIDNMGSVLWQKCLGGSNADIVFSFQQTIDGGYVLGGYTQSNNIDVSGNHGQDDYWVVKLDSNRAIEWQKCLGGTDNDYAESIQQTIDRGYIITGYTLSNNGDVNGNHGSLDYWVVKLDSIGNIEWQKCLGGTNQDWAYSIQQTNDKGYIVAGQSYSNNGDVTINYGNDDFWIAKLDSIGNLKWQKSLGGFDYDAAYSIKQTNDKGYIVAGMSASPNGNVTGNHGGTDMWVVKLDSTGNLIWQKCLGGTSYETAQCIQSTFDGGYIVAGMTNSNNDDVSGNHGSWDYWVVKLAPDTITSTTKPENTSNSFSFYPNPAQNELTITGNQLSEKSKIELFDITGRRVFKTQTTNGNAAKEIKINVSLLQRGVYTLRVGNSKNSVVKKVVLQ